MEIKIEKFVIHSPEGSIRATSQDHRGRSRQGAGRGSLRTWEHAFFRFGGWNARGFLG